MYESHHQPPLDRQRFAHRVLRHLAAAIGLLLASLAIGMLGYVLFERLSWIDAFLNAAMLLGGMGEVDALHTDAGKFFAGTYALFCGLLIVIASGVVLAPILHRVLHALHADDET
jgi:hypothetical protein